jgi:hypothetical protein
LHEGDSPIASSAVTNDGHRFIYILLHAGQGAREQWDPYTQFQLASNSDAKL